MLQTLVRPRRYSMDSVDYPGLSASTFHEKSARRCWYLVFCYLVYSGLLLRFCRLKWTTISMARFCRRSGELAPRFGSALLLQTLLTFVHGPVHRVTSQFYSRAFYTRKELLCLWVTAFMISYYMIFGSLDFFSISIRDDSIGNMSNHGRLTLTSTPFWPF